MSIPWLPVPTDNNSIAVTISNSNTAITTKGVVECTNFIVMADTLCFLTVGPVASVVPTVGGTVGGRAIPANTPLACTKRPQQAINVIGTAGVLYITPAG